jgi:hypothetical protein
LVAPPFSPSSVTVTSSLRQSTALPMQENPSFFSSRITSSAWPSPRRACRRIAVLSMLLEDDAEWQACIASLL